MTSLRLVSAAVLAGAVSAASPPSVSPASAAQAGVVRGRVIINTSPRLGERPAVTDLSARRHDPVDRRRSVVYLDDVRIKVFEDLRAGRARMDQKGEQFVPRLLAITVGTIVDFPNNDTTFHNVFSLSRVEPFDLGRYKPGRSGSVVFNRSGIVPVFCDIHSHMSAYILVFPHPFFAVTTTDGQYSIPNVPPGSYTITVWSELGRAQPKTVTLTPGQVVEADFQVGRDGS
jgi:plastocyanin